MTVVRPLGEIAHRMPEQGRIRLGKKGPRGPLKLQAFRFTSHDETAIRQIAALYGGSPRPWADGPRAGEWEVETTAKQVPVVLPPDPLGDTPVYELWSAGGCLRRCDGELAQVPDGDGIRPTPCICAQKNVLECKPKTRLLVVLRDVRFGGAWRIESGGWTAAQELPGMVEMIVSLQGQGLTAGLLTLKEEKRVKNGKTHRFMVPGLALDQSIVGLMQGMSSVDALASGDNVRALPAPKPTEVPRGTETQPWLDDGSDLGGAEPADNMPANMPASDFATADEVEKPAFGQVSEGCDKPENIIGANVTPDDDDVADAELVEPAGPPRKVTPAEVTFHQGIDQLRGLPEFDGKARADDLRHALVKLVTRGRTTSNLELNDIERGAANQLIDELLRGERRVVGFDPTTDTLKVSRPKASP